MTQRRQDARDPRRDLGRHGEDLAAQWYIERGFTVCERNWRCPRGEIDLIVTRGATIVFCEVKTRTSEYFGRPALAVGRDKQRRLRSLAATWLAARRGGSGPVRFDIAEVLVTKGHAPVVTVIEAAF